MFLTELRVSNLLALTTLGLSISINLALVRNYKGEGIPGLDYPAYSGVPPRLQFSCRNRIGYFADPETNCQVWHWCLKGGVKYSFICPSGSVFNQLYRVCDWWYNVDCKVAPNFYNVNEDLYKDGEGNLIVSKTHRRRVHQ